MDIIKLRERIDAVDKLLVDLFCERMKLAAEAGVEKFQLGLPLNDDKRELEIRKKIAGLPDKELAPYVNQFYQTLFHLAKEYQILRPAMGKQPEKKYE
ncbi:MAG: chorismate mutase [Firmicutes bacterium]|nr:chorismate mutase [Bacillota bacterium]